MSELYTGVVICGAVAIGSGLLCLMGQAMRLKRINRLLTAADNRIQGKSARRAATRTGAKVINATSPYQKPKDLSREGL